MKHDRKVALKIAIADRNVIAHELGQGGMATVYRAERFARDRTAARGSDGGAIRNFCIYVKILAIFFTSGYVPRQ